MTTPLELAKQGDPQALAALINKALQPQGLNARVVKQGQLLRVLVQSKQPPDQVKVVGFITNGVKKLGVEGVDELEVLGQHVGTKRPVWSEKVPLAALPPRPVHTSPSTSKSAKASPPETPAAKLTTDKRTRHTVVVGGMLLFGAVVSLTLYLREQPMPQSSQTVEAAQPTPTSQTTSSTPQQPAPAPRNGNRRTVSRATFSAEWMLTVDSGELVCEAPTAVVFISPNGMKYAVNGTAEAKGHADIRPIWKDDPEFADLGLKVDMGPLIEEGLKLCQ